MVQKKVVVLGGGAFGITLAKLSVEAEHSVVLWARSQKVCDSIEREHRHPSRLTSIKLPRELKATTNLKDALKDAHYILSALPMSALRSVVSRAKPFISGDALLMSTTKGIETSSNKLCHDIFLEVLGSKFEQRLAYLSGPSFAIEIAQHLPTAVTLASSSSALAKEFQKAFSSSYFRIYITHDVVGVLLGGALKNVIAIASGIAKGLSLGRNAMASLITRGLSEISRLALKMGALPATLSGLSGMGDLVLSCTDELSRNHQIGLFLASGFSLEEAQKKIGQVAEGVATASVIPHFCRAYGIEMPICQAVYRVLYEKKAPISELADLLKRELGMELVP